MDLTKIFKFLGGKITSHPSSKAQSSVELYKEWKFPEEYKQFNHPTWKSSRLEEDWNFIHSVAEHIGSLGYDVLFTNKNPSIWKTNSFENIKVENPKDFQKEIENCKNTKEITIVYFKEFINWYNKQNK